MAGVLTHRAAMRETRLEGNEQHWHWQVKREHMQKMILYLWREQVKDHWRQSSRLQASQAAGEKLSVLFYRAQLCSLIHVVSHRYKSWQVNFSVVSGGNPACL